MHRARCEHEWGKGGEIGVCNTRTVKKLFKSYHKVVSTISRNSDSTVKCEVVRNHSIKQGLEAKV